MNPVSRYVQEVERSLSGPRRLQTSAKIYKALSRKVDALEKRLGREPTDAEMTALLAEFGAPDEVAARFSAMGEAPRAHDLVERYLASVERRLPKKQAKDIVAELREVISARIEAEEEKLGRAANADEVAAVLKAYGHPVVTASRYAGFDYLIGPNYYPWFWHVQRIAVGATIAITFAIVAIRSLGADEPFRAAFRGFGGALEAALVCFGVVTALFVAAERTKLDMKWAKRWDPKALPRDHVREPKSLFESFIALVFDVIFILWWVKVVSFPNEVPLRDDASVAIHFSPAWAAVYWPILVLMVGAAVVHLSDLLHPAWSRLRSAVSIVGHVAGLAILWVLFRSQPLIDVTPANGTDAAGAEKVFRLAESIASISLGVTGLVWAITIGVEVWRLWQAARPPAVPPMPHRLSA